MKVRILVLPGAASPTVVQSYKIVYQAIEDEARRRDLECLTIHYPGQRAEQEDLLTFESAVAATRVACQTYAPNWMVCRSFGTLVACGVLNSEDAWVKECCGAVFWGPRLGSKRRADIPADKRAEQIARDLKARGTRFAPDFYDTVPGIEDGIGLAQCKLRIARGEFDEYNTTNDLNLLKRIHDEAQPNFGAEVVEIPKLPHEVLPANTPYDSLEEYFDCLFRPLNA